MVQLTTGTSSKIDSCAGLILSRANKTFSRIREIDRRWIDHDDLVQDNLLSAVKTERDHHGNGQKYSTHLFNRINWDSGHLLLALSRQMRRAASVQELDAPGPDGELYLLPDKTAHEDLIAGTDAEDRVSAFKRLVVAVQSSAVYKAEQFRAVEHLVRVVLFHRKGPEFAELPVETQQILVAAAKKSAIRYSDIQGCGDDEGSRKRLLQWAAAAVIMEPGAENKLRCLECVKCRGGFTLTDVREQRYFLEPGMCRTCYARMQRNPQTCFGKVQTATQLGYQSKDPACRLHCPDRAVCREIAKGRLTMPDKVTKKKANVKDKTKVDEKLAKGLDAIDAAVKTKKPEASAKTEKVAPEKKTAKAPAVQSDEQKFPPSREFGGHYPWRAGSAMRYMFLAVFTAEGGLSIKKFDALFREPTEMEPAKFIRRGETPGTYGSGPLFSVGTRDYMFAKLRSGSAGKSVKTHTWKFTEEGGVLKIYDVKCLVKAKDAPEKADKPVVKKSEAVKSAKRDKAAKKKK